MSKNNTVRHAGGYIIQLLPFATEETISALEKCLTNFPPITTILDQGKSPEDIIEMIFGDSNYRITDSMDAKFACGCSKELMRGSLLRISKKDIEDMIEDGETIEMRCHYCGTTSYFTVEELGEILQSKKRM